MPSASRRQRSQILDLLKRFEPELARAFAESVADLRAGVDIAALERALAAGNLEAAIQALRLDTAAFLRLETALAANYSAVGTATAASISALRNPATGARLFVRFDLRNPRAEAWLREHSSRRIVEIVADQREAVRVIAEAGVRLGDNPRRTALDIVGRINRVTGRREGGVIGLTSTQAQWVANAREELASDDPALLRRYLGRERRDKRFDRAILRAIRDGEPLPADTIRRATERYSDRMLQLRGETVARTEALSGLNAARDEAFRQAVDSGQISRQQVTKVWNATGDSRTRDSHEAMDGQEVPLDQPFETPDGYRLMYPTDSSLGAPAEETIQCRCWLEQRVDFFAGVT
jgi:hypothetical protein